MMNYQKKELHQKEYQGMNLKQLKGLYSENCEMLVKEIENGTEEMERYKMLLNL